MKKDYPLLFYKQMEYLADHPILQIRFILIQLFLITTWGLLQILL